MDNKPVYCFLCFKSENPANAISCDPPVVTILCRQFWFSPEEIERKSVCSICWTYVDEFNQFYEQIKMIHHTEEQQQLALQENSMHFDDFDRKETAVLLEEESSLIAETLAVDEYRDADPLISQVKTETITIESIDIVDVIKEETGKINAGYGSYSEESFREQDLPNTRRISSTLARPGCNTFENTTEESGCDALPTTHQQTLVPYHDLTCTDCAKSFPTEQRLQQHLKRDHKPGLMCDICSKWVKTKEGLRKHQQNSHFPQTTERVECSICNKWMKNNGSLQKHLIRHRTSDKPNICEICGKVAPNYAALKSHKLFVHIKQRTFRCLVCKKAFKRAFTLEEHMTTHTGSSLYNCPHCTRTFNSSANLHAHRKKVHRKEWEISRNEYEKRFRGE